MNAAVNVGVIALVIIYQRIDDALGFLRRGGIIKVDERLAVNLLVKDREISAKILPSGIHVILVARLFGGGGLRVAFGGIEGRMPAEGGALNPGRELMDPGEGREIRHIIFHDLAGGDHLVEISVNGFGLGDGLALEVDGHERSAGFGNGASTALETDIADPVTVALHIDGDLIATHRVVPTPNAIGAGQHGVIPWAAVVV